MSRRVRPKMISVCKKKKKKKNDSPFIALSYQKFVYTILFMTKNIRMATQES